MYLLKKRSFFKRTYPYIASIIILMIYMLPGGDMCGDGDDAADIWKTITSWYSDDIYPSYVLYKGIISVYPFVWLYKMAMICHVNEWLFIKIFYILCFSLSTTFLFPGIVEILFRVKVKEYHRLLLFFACFWLWEPTRAIRSLTVDSPCMFYFLCFIYLALRINKKHHRLYYGALGVSFGLICVGSGQYIVASICGGIFLLVSVVKNHEKLKSKMHLLETIPFLVGTITIILWNGFFQSVIVQAFVNAGAWIPDNKAWLGIGYLRFMDYLELYPTNIYTNGVVAVLQQYYGSGFENLENIYKNGMPITMLDYFKIVFSHPFDYLARYFQRFMLIISPPGHLSLAKGIVMYSIDFAFIYKIFNRYNTFRKMAKAKFWIVFAFLWSVAYDIVFVLECRRVMQFQGLIIATAICAIDFKELFVSLRGGIHHVADVNMVTFYKYIVFVILCFIAITALYDNSTHILFSVF